MIRLMRILCWSACMGAMGKSNPNGTCYCSKRRFTLRITENQILAAPAALLTTLLHSPDFRKSNISDTTVTPLHALASLHADLPVLFSRSSLPLPNPSLLFQIHSSLSTNLSFSFSVEMYPPSKPISPVSLFFSQRSLC
uniref:Secreted protein n=1 Tax=Kalanchoe fedtschenkoi TaxID=63787 RepID=A0A7N0UZ53_KALFE